MRGRKQRKLWKQQRGRRPAGRSPTSSWPQKDSWPAFITDEVLTGTLEEINFITAGCTSRSSCSVFILTVRARRGIVVMIIPLLVATARSGTMCSGEQLNEGLEELHTVRIR